jgi:hypothetical protein
MPRARPFSHRHRRRIFTAIPHSTSAPRECGDGLDGDDVWVVALPFPRLTPTGVKQVATPRSQLALTAARTSFHDITCWPRGHLFAIAESTRCLFTCCTSWFRCKVDFFFKVCFKVFLRTFRTSLSPPPSALRPHSTVRCLWIFEMRD